MRQFFFTLAKLLHIKVALIEIVADEQVIVERLRKPRERREADLSIYRLVESQYEALDREHLTIESKPDNIDEMLAKADAYIANVNEEKKYPIVRNMFMILLSLGVLTGCSRQQGDTAHDDIHAEEVHQAEGPGGALVLNNGDKWDADAHTLLVVREMKSEVSDFEGANRKDYAVLADSLTSQLNRLVAGCTMEGPAHDELHKWLIPLSDDVKDLKSSANVSGTHKVIEIKESLGLFNDFFGTKLN